MFTHLVMLATVFELGLQLRQPEGESLLILLRRLAGGNPRHIFYMPRAPPQDPSRRLCLDRPPEPVFHLILVMHRSDRYILVSSVFVFFGVCNNYNVVVSLHPAYCKGNCLVLSSLVAVKRSREGCFLFWASNYGHVEALPQGTPFMGVSSLGRGPRRGLLTGHILTLVSVPVRTEA